MVYLSGHNVVNAFPSHKDKNNMTKRFLFFKEAMVESKGPLWGVTQFHAQVLPTLPLGGVGRTGA